MTVYTTLPERHKEDTQSVTGKSNDTDTTYIGCTNGENVEKAGRKAGSVQPIDNRQCYETKGEKCQFISESF